jgi:hypothetical protein
MKIFLGFLLICAAFYASVAELKDDNSSEEHDLILIDNPGKNTKILPRTLKCKPGEVKTVKGRCIKLIREI